MRQFAAILIATRIASADLASAQESSTAEPPSLRSMRVAYGLADRDWPKAIRSAEDAVQLAVRELNQRLEELLDDGRSGDEAVKTFTFESALLKYVNEKYDPLLHRALSLAQHVRQRPEAIRQLQRERIDLDQISATWALNAKGIARELIGRRLSEGSPLAYRWVPLQDLVVPARSIAIEIVKFEMYELDRNGKSGPRYGIWFIDPTRRVRTHIVDARRSLDLEQQARNAHGLIGSLRSGYDVPMRTIRDMIFGGEVPRADWWIVSPAADLWLVPFAALPVKKGSGTRAIPGPSDSEWFAVERYVISYAMSCRFLTRQLAAPNRPLSTPETAGSKIRALLFANPTFDMPLSKQALAAISVGDRVTVDGKNVSLRIAVNGGSRIVVNVSSGTVVPVIAVTGRWIWTEIIGSDGQIRRGWLENREVTKVNERLSGGTLQPIRLAVQTAVDSAPRSIQTADRFQAIHRRSTGCAHPPRRYLIQPPSCCAPAQPLPLRGQAQLLTLEFAPPLRADAIPTLGADFNPVPQTETLALAIVEELKNGSRKPAAARVLAGDNARELEFHNAEQVDLLVFCTHGFFFKPNPSGGPLEEYERLLTTNPDPFMRCGLLLAGARTRVDQPQAEIKPGKLDGILAGREIVARRPAVGRTLVALLACQGGEGTQLRGSDDQIAGDSLASLRESFLTSGSVAVLASNWKLRLTTRERDPSRLIVLDFFERVSRGSATATESSVEGIAPYVRALHEAQRAYLSSPDSAGLRHPYHWAALSITGRWAHPDAPIGGTEIDKTGEVP